MKYRYPGWSEPMEHIAPSTEPLSLGEARKTERTVGDTEIMGGAKEISMGRFYKYFSIII